MSRSDLTLIIIIVIVGAFCYGIFGGR